MALENSTSTLGRLLAIKLLQSRLVSAFAPTGGRALNTHAYRWWVSPTKFSGNPKISAQLHCNQKYQLILWYFIFRNLRMNMIDQEKLQTNVRITSIETRNISSTIFDDKNFMNMMAVLFAFKYIIFGNIITQKHWT